jgi:hypothetical protein
MNLYDQEVKKNVYSHRLPISYFYKEYLKSAMVNPRWSWGSMNDKHVFLNIWETRVNGKGEIEMDQFGQNWVAIQWESDVDTLGYKERAKHLEALMKGKPTYGVLCQKHETECKIQSYDLEYLRVIQPSLKFDPATGITFALLGKHVGFYELMEG